MRTWNGDYLQVALVLDACGRQAIAVTALHSFLEGEMRRDLTLSFLEHQFVANVGVL